ncbi:hypothetical protein ACCQ14_00300 [Xanthomonas sp. NCPPB 2865]|uniref:hypothetical protein n=1 Tax=unclassified Xanthomonas TaxID=2643310 RepID=UPI001CF916AE|nr:hypothetical protein [Xanthomonas sp. MWU16-30325]
MSDVLPGLEEQPSAKDGIELAYKEHQDLLIFALTGRTGSGCTTAADLLSKNFNENLSAHFKTSGPDARKQEIITNYVSQNWEPFSKITVSSLLLTFLAGQDGDAPKSECETNADESTFFKKLSNISNILLKVKNDAKDLLLALDEPSPIFYSKDWASSAQIKQQLTQLLPELLIQVKTALGEQYNSFLQEVGDNLRKSGNAYKKEINSEMLFALPHRITRAIECIREVDKKFSRKTRIVIDAIRNPLELVYIKDRYSPLYVVAVTADEAERQRRLLSNNYTASSIAAIDEREHPVKHNPYASYESLITQDIQSCLQKSDIFISNPGDLRRSDNAESYEKGNLYGQLLRYYALALRPGLVTPTKDERCMQVAFIAKANSGCISRQVGAAITDENFAVKAIGWNDVPRGQVPCSLRNVDDLILAKDEEAYSDYERSEGLLRSHIVEKHKEREVLETKGIPCSYCFKDAANQSIFKKDGRNGTNQVHTRSLHAEENAFLQLTHGGPSVKGGSLFTTASPCELCSKKAYQLGVSEIIYIDPYPGISIPHIISTGKFSARPGLRLFSGAVGKAYHRLYEPMIPIKDEIAAWLGL